MPSPVNKQSGEYQSTVQDLSKFRNPPGFRGASVFKVQLWWIVQASLFRWSPQIAFPFRAFLLRLFGANVGKKTFIRPSVQVTYPWKVTIGDFVWIGDDVVLYSLGPIEIGPHTVVSQRSYLCAGDHDYREIAFPIRSSPINIGAECWLAADCFIYPGVTIGMGSVISARSVVIHDMPGMKICKGTPCSVIADRCSP